MGHGFKSGTGSAWTFDSLVRAIRCANGGPYRLLGVAERRRVLSILACLPREVKQIKGVGHYSFWHAPSSRTCGWCRAEAISISICDSLARRRQEQEEIIEGAA